MATACNGKPGKADDKPDAGETPELHSSVTVFRPGTPGAGLAWGEVPFPSDLYLDADGRLALTTLPAGAGADAAFSVLMLDAIHTIDRVPPFTNVYFPITGELDPATLAGNVKLVDLDNGLAEIPIDIVWRGALVPGTTREDLSSIVIAVKFGTTLRPNRAYAAYVTNGVKATDGTTLGRAQAFANVVDLAVVPSNPALRAAQDSLRPLLERLPAETVASLAIATVFHTGDVSRDLVAMRNAVAATPPTITVTEVRTDLDFFFGVQDPAAPPGYSEIATYEGRVGYRGQPHGNVAAIVHGTIGLPSFSLRADLSPKLLEYDGNGKPLLETVLHVPFTIVLPKAASYQSLPAMVYVHGVNRTRVDSLIVADDAAARGIATVTFDLMFHGSRALGATDYVNFVTGAEAPDGFGDPVGLFAPIRFFHLADNGTVPPYHPLVMRGNLMQSTIDICSVVSFVRGGDVAAINTALANAGLPADLAFRPSVVLQGESFGSMLGATALAVEPALKVGALNVAPVGFAWPSLLHSGAFSGIFGGIVLDSFDVAGRVKLGDPLRDARFDPMVMIWNYALASGDPVNYLWALASGELRGGERPSILLNESWSDEYVPNSATEHLAGALGLPRMTLSLPITPDPAVWGTPEQRFVSIPQQAGPLTGNLGAGTTGAVAFWYPATHGLNYWYDDASTIEPYHPPFITRVNQVPLVNPTREVHRLWGDFFSTYFASGTPTLADPF